MAGHYVFGAVIGAGALIWGVTHRDYVQAALGAVLLASELLWLRRERRDKRSGPAAELSPPKDAMLWVAAIVVAAALFIVSAITGVPVWGLVLLPGAVLVGLYVVLPRVRRKRRGAA